MRGSTFLLIILIVSILIFPLQAQNVVINEIMSLNVETAPDEDGDYPDWIELYNAENNIVNLKGFGLSDDPDEPLKWVLPETIINPHRHLLVFASGKDRKLWANRIETIITHGDTWRYRIGNRPPPYPWREAEYDDSDWLSGPSGFGFGDYDDSTETERTLSIYVRKTFNIDDLANVTGALLHVDYDDGFVAYLNGAEIARANIGTPGTQPAYNTPADLDHEALMYQGLPPELFEIDNALELLNTGQNVLAIQVHNSDTASSDLSLIPFLTLGLNASPPNPRGVPEVLESALPAFHTNFRIRSGGEPLTLSDSTGQVIDSLESITIPGDISYGRRSDGEVSWMFFLEPTPRSSNSGQGWVDISGKPEFSPVGGIYPDAVSINIIPPADNASIYYTLDGSNPTEQSEIYAAPITIDTSTVVKAVAFIPDHLPSEIVTQSYIVGYSSDFPIISLSTDPVNLWDEDTGIYVLGREYEPDPPHRGANYWQDWERPIHIEFFEPDGSLGFSANAGVKIHGGWTRFFDQKSLALFARQQYGDNDFDYQIFPDLSIDKFEAVILRNGGSDWDHTGFRDAFMVSLMEGADLDVQAYRPSVIFLNGVYWGIQNIREKKNEHYIASHHNVDADSIDRMNVWGGIMNGDNSHFNAMMDFVTNRDMSDSANYEYVTTLLDVDNFINWNLAHIYFDNTDWPGNNNEFWRPRSPGGKWRWILFDTDFGFGLHDDEAYRHNTLEFATNDEGDAWPNPAYATLLLRKLLENSRFSNDFINRFADFMNFYFQPSHIRDRIDQFKAMLEIEIEAHLERWDRDMEGWNEKVDELYYFAEQRPGPMRGFIREFFNLSGTANVTLNVIPPQAGTIKINTKTPLSFPWNGVYFKDVPIEITAIPSGNNRYRFSRWSGSLNTSEQSVSVTLNGNERFIAIFEEINYQDSGIVINEINYNSSPDFDTEDWIELHSISGNHDLDGYFLRDDDSTNQFIFPPGTLLREGEYLIVIRDSAAFTNFFPDVSNIVGNLSFSLNNTGDQIRLYNPMGVLIDSVLYDDIAPWPIEPDGTGATLELIDPASPNDDPQNWRASLAPNGSPGFNNIYNSPLSFSLASPANGSIVESDSVIVQWTASMDPDPGDTIVYQVEWSLNAGFTPSMQATTPDTFWLIRDDPSVIVTSMSRSLRSISGINAKQSDSYVFASDFRHSREDGNPAWFNPNKFPHSRVIPLTAHKNTTDALPDSQTVYWRVKAIDMLGLETIAEPGPTGWSFEIRLPYHQQNRPPGSFTLLSPEHGSAMDNDTVMVQWSVSIDPDADEVHYQVEWSLSSSFSPSLLTATMDTFYTISDDPSIGHSSIYCHSQSVSRHSREDGNPAWFNPNKFPHSRVTSSTAHKNSTDALPDSQVVFWRVKAIDSGGLETIAYPGPIGFLFRIQLPYEELPQIPDEFNIGFAYPNPFNSRFVIPVEMDQPGVINVKMWDMLGHIVLNSSHSLSAGYHDFVLFDENGNIKLPAGVYILNVRNGNYLHQQRVVSLGFIRN
ncbi:MAG: CotH kinase family protein [Candidatus Hatepunaea meridiana]|nr:CotH kinase family protein [Candidatus Hatepunaea meridiana]